MPVWYQSDFNIHPCLTKIPSNIHPVCMQLPKNASLAFFGFIMHYPLLEGHVGFWQSLSFTHFGYNLLPELRKYVFLCRLAIKCYFLNKILYIFIHSWILTQFYRFSVANLDLAAILNLFTVKMVHFIVQLSSLHKMSPFQNIIFI